MGKAMMGAGKAKGEDRAREAAELAIRSPLLEDINLSGARGLLVNITAGMDMGIHEFDEVGSTIREFACDDATVVVGTVIDPEMTDEMRVTVVATGLEAPAARLSAVPDSLDMPMKKVANGDLADANATEESLDKPTVIRQNPQNPAREYVDAAINKDMEFLDIPAFLRRQAD
jgi:cell division protein FtsZ